jgi:hypothetical protein
MIATKIEVPQAEYLFMKKSVLEGILFTRIDIKLTDVKIKSTKVILIEDREIKVSKSALSQLCDALGMNKSFYDLISSTVDADTQLVNLIISSIKKSKVDKITILFHNTFNEVTAIYPTGNKLISDAQYFETLEKVLAKEPSCYLRNLVIMPNGNISSTIANPALEFSLGNIEDETFTGGMTLDLIDNSLKTTFFTERLVCSNGNTITHKTCTKSVRVNSEVPSFIEALLSPSYQFQSVEQFKTRVNRIYDTRASLREVLNIDNRVRSVLGSSLDAEILMENMSANYFKKIFTENYLNKTDIHQYLRTNITVWDLVNEVTAISSRIEQNRIALDNRVNRTLQIIGGNLIFQNPDLAPTSIKQLF